MAFHPSGPDSVPIALRANGPIRKLGKDRLATLPLPGMPSSYGVYTMRREARSRVFTDTLRDEILEARVGIEPTKLRFAGARVDHSANGP